MKEREHRTSVVLPARMRWEDRWTAATICNISPHGMMIRSASLPPPGAYVEVELPSATVTARAVWTKGAHCGLRAREKLNVDGFVAPGRRRARAASPPRARAAPARSAILDVAAAGRRLSSACQLVSVAAAGAMAAAAIGWQLYETLAAPAAAIATSMGVE